MRMIKRLLLNPGITVFAIILSWLVMLWINRIMTVQSLGEDSLVEWFQVALLAITVLYGVRIARLTPDRFVRMAFVLFSAAAAFVMLEEISWGQRLLNLDTPGSLESWNQQRELSLHNHVRLDNLINWLPVTLLGFLGLGASVGTTSRDPDATGMKFLLPPPSFRLSFALLLFTGLVELWRGAGSRNSNAVVHFLFDNDSHEVRELAVVVVILAYAYNRYRYLRRVRGHQVLTSKMGGGGEDVTESRWLPCVTIPACVFGLWFTGVLLLVAKNALVLRSEPVHWSQSYAVYFESTGRFRPDVVYFVSLGCDESDQAGRFYLHSYPSNTDDLEHGFVERGFHNRDFVFADYGWRVFDTCWVRVEAPQYPLVSVHFGQYIPEPSGRLRNLWHGEHPVLAEPEPN